MADPRLSIGVAGVAPVYMAFKTAITYDATASGGAATTAIGHAVTLSSADTVSLAGDGVEVIGKLISVEKDGICTVQIMGGMTLPGGDSAALTLGKAIVGALDGSAASGHIREVATGTAAELGLCRGFIVDAGTTTAVEVMLI